MGQRKLHSMKGAVAVARRIESSILVIRGQRVLLDSAVAELYGVSTKVQNQAVKRNSERFPEDFAFPLTMSEAANLKSQIVTSSWGGNRKPPRVFTEHGVAMLSSVLRSTTAARVNIEIMRAFVRLRRLLATPGELAQQLTRLAETVELHDDQIKAITDVLKNDVGSPTTARDGFPRDSPRAGVNSFTNVSCIAHQSHTTSSSITALGIVKSAA